MKVLTIMVEAVTIGAGLSVIARNVAEIVKIRRDMRKRDE